MEQNNEMLGWNEVARRRAEDALLESYTSLRSERGSSLSRYASVEARNVSGEVGDGPLSLSGHSRRYEMQSNSVLTD